jgi:hypothetical protein
MKNLIRLLSVHRFVVGVVTILVIVILSSLFIFFQAVSKPAPQVTIIQTHPGKILDKDETIAFNGINPKSSQKDIDGYYAFLSKLSTPGDTIDLTGCSPTPLILKVTTSTQQVTVVNNDNVKHIMIIDGKHTYEIPAKGKKQLNPAFKNPPLYFRYTCDRSVDAVGMIYLSK